MPLTVSTSAMEVIWLVRGDAREGVDYDRTKLTWLWRVTSEADKRITEDNQAGVNSRYYTPGPYPRWSRTRSGTSRGISGRWRGAKWERGNALLLCRLPNLHLDPQSGRVEHAYESVNFKQGYFAAHQVGKARLGDAERRRGFGWDFSPLFLYVLFEAGH